MRKRSRVKRYLKSVTITPRGFLFMLVGLLCVFVLLMIWNSMPGSGGLPGEKGWFGRTVGQFSRSWNRLSEKQK